MKRLLRRLLSTSPYLWVGPITQGRWRAGGGRRGGGGGGSWGERTRRRRWGRRGGRGQAWGETIEYWSGGGGEEESEVVQRADGRRGGGAGGHVEGRRWRRWRRRVKANVVSAVWDLSDATEDRPQTLRHNPAAQEEWSGGVRAATNDQRNHRWIFQWFKKKKNMIWFLVLC